MKPQNKLHLKVVNLANYLSPLSIIQENWAIKHCLKHEGFANKSRVLCLDCGDTFSPKLVIRKSAICPSCKTKILVSDSLCTTNNQVNYFAIALVLEQFQVVRNFEITANYKKGRAASYQIKEIMQYWISPDNKITLHGLNHTLNWHTDNWNGKLEIRQHKGYFNADKYDIYPRFYYPKSFFKEEFLKYGVNVNLTAINIIDAIKILPNNPKAETLLKAKQYSLLSNYCNSHYDVSKHWNSIKICLRNKYKVMDSRIYLDYLDLLAYFKKDLQSPKFVCPKNLKSAHNSLMRKKRAILRLEAIEQEKLERIERQQNIEKKQKAIIEYEERFNKFFHLEFIKNDISITPLKSVEEFKKEGDELEHCVYTNEYYLKENTLILSAKVKGKRTETIKFKLDTMKIEQSRGFDNEPSYYNKEIISIVNKNRKLIAEALK